MTVLTLRQLEIFVQVVRLGSFRRCAEHIGVSQMAISDHIRSLEIGLGGQLFDRKAGGPARLTAQGEKAYRRAAGVLDEIDAMAREVCERADRRKLKVGTHPFIMRHLQQSIAGFAEDYPSIDLNADLELMTPALIKHALQQTALDVGYFFAFGDDDCGIDSDVVREEPLGIFICDQHPLATVEVVTPAELLAVPMVQLSPRNVLRPLVDRALKRIGISGGPVGFETDEYGLIVSSVQRNVGYACMFRSVERDLSRVGGIKPLRLTTEPPGLQIRQALREGWRDDSVLSDLVSRLSAALRTA
jgi:DNA-binding transcriptional LysR family regulator